MPDTELAPRVCFLGAGCLDKLLSVSQIARTLPCACESKASRCQNLAGPQVCGAEGTEGVVIIMCVPLPQSPGSEIIWTQ